LLVSLIIDIDLSVDRHKDERPLPTLFLQSYNKILIFLTNVATFIINLSLHK